jgi:hypothetical protein
LKIEVPKGDLQFSPHEWFRTTAFKQNATVFETGLSGYCMDTEKLFKDVDELKGQLLQRTFSIFKPDTVSLYSFGNTVVSIGIGNESQASITIYSVEEAQIRLIAKTLASHLTSATPKGQIGMLVSEYGSLVIKPMGIVGKPLIRDNYTEKVLEGYDAIKQQLVAESPFGRLHILEGPAGTGKSYMIRALMEELESQFVFVPGSMVSELAKPHFIPTIMDRTGSLEDIEFDTISPSFSKPKENEKNDPLILVIEDADSIITDRNRNNMEVLSTLLNLGDGILGDLSNIRMVMSTNSTLDQVDKAAKRAGRLGKHVKLNYLTRDQATAAYKNIVGKDFAGDWKTEITLADIYAEANEDTKRSFSDTPKVERQPYA